MNSLSSCMIVNPYGKTDSCAQFNIDEVLTPFVLHNVAMPGNNYTFSCWVKSDDVGGILVGNTEFTSAYNSWTKVVSKFTASSERVPISFTQVGVYYIYEAQLELGTVATDWSPAPEDVSESILDVSARLSVLSDSIRMEFEATKETIQETKDGVDTEFAEMKKYIDYGYDGITISNGENSAIRLVVDNTGISFFKAGQQEPFGFWDGTDFLTGNIIVRVEERAQFGDFAFVPRSDGSLSFLMTGQTSPSKAFMADSVLKIRNTGSALNGETAVIEDITTSMRDTVLVLEV